jgi:outer membrane protein assembly factor BamB
MIGIPMKTSFTIVTGLLALSIEASLLGSDWPQWRGPQRNGTSEETGLLKEWPKEGPKLLWKVTDVGSGYAAPAVAGGRIYILGNEGLENESLESRAVADGKKIWSTRLGKVGNPNQNPSFPAARSTPTVAGDLAVALGSDGDLVCVETASGKAHWRKNLRNDFGGKPGEWAYSESPLVDGEAVICTPGGSDATVVALSRKTGETLWKCAVAGGDLAAYSSAIMIEAGGVKQYVQLLQKGLVGIATDGKFLWRYPRPVSKYGANIPTPLGSDGYVYVASAGTGGGLVRIKAENGKPNAQEVYFDLKMPTAIGGVVKVGNALYGTTAQRLVCLDFLTGTTKWDAPAIGPAAICSADGCLYLHGENGEAALIQATPDGYHETGRFSPAGKAANAKPMEKSWAYPAVADGKLYLRQHATLWCYDLKK